MSQGVFEDGSDEEEEDGVGLLVSEWTVCVCQHERREVAPVAGL